MQAAPAHVDITQLATDPEIRPTDIVFDCPICGHNLVIDYKGAGLQVTCTECGNLIQAPIPEGMHVSDLDLSPGELLSQLFQTRRLLQKTEQRIGELEATSTSLREARSQHEHAHVATLRRCAEMTGLCNSLLRSQSEQAQMVNRIMQLLSEEQQK